MKNEKYFSAEFIKKMMLNYAPTSKIEVNEVKLFSIDNSASILVTLTSESSDEFIGHFGLEVAYLLDGEEKHSKMVMKVKPHGVAISDMLSGLSGMCCESVHQEYSKVKNNTGFYNTHDKEIFIYTEQKSDMYPVVYGYYINEEENVYALLMEYFEDVELLNSVMNTNEWDNSKIKIGVNAMTRWHINHTNNTSWYTHKFNDYRTYEQIESLIPTWKVLLDNAKQRFPELYTNNIVEKLNFGINEMATLWNELITVPKSVVHNDFNPRNAFFKKNADNLNICVYDWELATVHFPVYDLVEFLSFTAGSLTDDQLQDHILDFHKVLAEKFSEYENPKTFNKTLLCSVFDFGLHRLGMYMMAHSVGPYPFIPHVVNNFERILNFAHQKR